MPDKKLTDNEIVKALEICQGAHDNDTCNNCKYKRNFGCRDALCNDTLDLINRQNAEIERLKKEVAYWETEMKEARADIDQAVTEAYKVFAESAVERVDNAKQKYQRLCKEQGEEMEEHMHIHFNGITKIINNLLKELVGEDG